MTGRLRISSKQRYKSFVKSQGKLNCLTKIVEYKFGKVSRLARETKKINK